MRIKKLLKELLKLIIGIGLIIIFIRHIQWGDFIKTVNSVNISWMLLGIGLTLVNMPIAAYRWYLLLTAYHTNIRFLNIINLFFISAFFNTFLPGGFAGDVVRGIQTRAEGLNVGDSFSSVLMDRMLGLFGLVFLSLIGVGFQWQLVKHSGLLAYLLIICIGFILLIIVLYNRRIMKHFRILTSWLGKWEKRLEDLYRSLYQYRYKLNRIFFVFGITLLNHLIMFISVYCLALSLHVHISFTYFVLFLPIIGILSMLPVTIGGLGLRESGFLIFFPLVGMTKAQALGTSLFFFMTTVLIALVGAVIYLGRSFKTIVITTRASKR